MNTTYQACINLFQSLAGMEADLKVKRRLLLQRLIEIYNADSWKIVDDLPEILKNSEFIYRRENLFLVIDGLNTKWHLEVREVLDQVKWLFNDTDQKSIDLPPYLKKVLECLIQGFNSKEAARKLNISNHTYNSYTKEIYQYFMVGSKRELTGLYKKGLLKNER